MIAVTSQQLTLTTGIEPMVPIEQEHQGVPWAGARWGNRMGQASESGGDNWCAQAYRAIQVTLTSSPAP